MTETNEEYKEFHDRNARLAMGDSEIIIRNGDVMNAVERYLAMDNEEQAVDYAKRLRFFLENSLSQKHGDLLYRIFMSLLDDTKHRLEVKAHVSDIDKDPSKMTPQEVADEQIRQSREQTKLLRKILKYNKKIWKDML